MMYRKTYRCIVEGQQEDIYLHHLATLLTEFPNIVVKFNTSEGNAYELTKSYVEYDSACLFDYDFNKTEFEMNLAICAQLDRTNQKNNKKQSARVFHAYSNVCFDLWLLLHKKDWFSPVLSNDAYVKDVIELYNLPKDSDIKEKKVMKRIVSQISLLDIRCAIDRAKRICERKIAEDAICIDTIKYYDNPDLSIHSFVEKVLLDVPSFSNHL